MKNKKSGKFKKVLDCLCQQVNEHWIVVAIIFLGASLWFSVILGFFGESWGLIERKVNTETKTEYTTLSISGIIITVVILIMYVALTLLNRYKETNNDYEKKLTILESGYNLFDKILSTVTSICNHKYSTQMKTIEDIKENNSEPPIVYTDPCKQFEIIISQLTECVAFLLSEKGRNFKRNDLYASVAYNFPLENKNTWKWVDIGDERGLPIEKVIENGSTFSYLLNNSTSEHSSVFFNSKQEAYNSHNYIIDECDKKDEKGELKGSIACYKITLKRLDKIYGIAVLSISSYNQKFVEMSPTDDKDKQKEKIENVSANIENFIVSELSVRIRIELCNYYLQFLRDKWEKIESDA